MNPCKICNHPHRDEIEAMIKLDDFSFADIERRYSVNYQNIHNHELHMKTYVGRIVDYVERIVRTPEEERTISENKRLRALKNALPSEHRYNWKQYINDPIPDGQSKEDTIKSREKMNVKEEDFQDAGYFKKIKDVTEKILSINRT